MKVERWQLLQRQNQPLEVKIELSKLRITTWHEAWDGEVYVAFSGGLDSTVLLHLVRSMYPDCPAMFCNTGVEYPEIVRFVRSTPTVEWIQPKMRFSQIVRKYGYPVISKRIARYVHDIRNMPEGSKTRRLRLTGYINSGGKYRSCYMLSKKWRFLIDAPFEISNRCCALLKKNPARKAGIKFGAPFLGMRADEGDQRLQMYYRFGCNAFDLKRPRSWPLAFWKDEDIWEYIRRFDVSYSALYDMGYKRSGCFPCMFGVHLEKEPNRFQMMMKTHPRLYKYCMDKLGLAEVLDYIGVPYKEPVQPRLFP